LGQGAIPFRKKDNTMWRQVVKNLRRPAAVAALIVDRLGVFFLLALGVTAGGASLLAGF